MRGAVERLGFGRLRGFGGLGGRGGLRGVRRIFGRAPAIASTFDTARLLQSGRSMVRKLVASIPALSANSAAVKWPS